MTLLQWRPAQNGDGGALQSFVCTSPAKGSTSYPFRSHSKSWELDVQSYVRSCKIRQAPGHHLWVGLDGEGIGAVFAIDMSGNDAFIRCAAVASRHRGSGGGVADETFTVLLDEISGLAISAGWAAVRVYGYVHPQNAPSQDAARRNGFRHVGQDGDYQVWSITLVFPPEVFQPELPLVPVSTHS